MLFEILVIGVLIFIGVPDQVGVQVSDASFDLAVTDTAVGSNFDLEVEGTVSLFGLPGIVISGMVKTTVSSTGSGAARVLDITTMGGTATDPLVINTPLGQFEGILTFTRDGASGDVMVSGIGISYFIGGVIEEVRRMCIRVVCGVFLCVKLVY